MTLKPNSILAYVHPYTPSMVIEMIFISNKRDFDQEVEICL